MTSIPRRPAEVVAVIPARGGSKGLPRKNLRLLGGIPLVVHAIRQAQSAREVQRVIVSTEDDEIADVALGAGAEVLRRPPELASDEATDLQVFVHVLAALEEAEGAVPELLVQVRATSPVRRPPLIDLAIRTLRTDPAADSLRTVSLAAFTPYKMWTLDEKGIASPLLARESHLLAKDWFDGPRQALPDAFEHDGLVDVVRSRTVRAGSMAGHRIIGLTHADPAVDIDREADLLDAERLLRPVGGAAARCDVGIRQGQLVPAWNGAPQRFPRGRWEEEFELAARCGLPNIELSIDRRDSDANPVFAAAGRADLVRVARRYGVTTASACLDDLLHNPLVHRPVEAFVGELARDLSEVSVATAVFPLRGASAYLWPPPPKLVATLRRLGDQYARFGIRIALETDLPGSDLFRFLGVVAHRNIGICFDTGNPTALGHETAEDVRLLGPAIWHVHVKDNDAFGVDVSLATGSTRITAILAALHSAGYAGALTLETPQGPIPTQAAARFRDYVLSLWTCGTTY